MQPGPWHRAVHSAALAWARRRSTTSPAASSELARRSLGPLALAAAGSRVLSQPAVAVTHAELASDEFAARLAQMRETMLAHGGIGIAAPQVSWSKQVFLMGEPDSKEIPLRAVVNPAILWQSDEIVWFWEGCLSLPGLAGWVPRPAAIRARAQTADRAGAPAELLELSGMAARVFQHEFDHLRGILFTDRVPSARFVVPAVSLVDLAAHKHDWPSRAAARTAHGVFSSEQ